MQYLLFLSVLLNLFFQSVNIRERRGRVNAVRMPSYNLMGYLKDRVLLDYVAERPDFPIQETSVSWLIQKENYWLKYMVKMADLDQ